MDSEARVIELAVVSATDLKKVKKFGSAQQKCYVVAYIYPAQRQATHPDGAGGVNPTWNAPLTLTCYETDLYPGSHSYGGGAKRSSSSSASSSSSSRSIHIEIYARSNGFFSSGDKLVGTVVVPLQSIASAVQEENLTTMAFDVRRPASGKVQGKLNLTMKLGPKHTIMGASAPHQQQMPSYAYYKSKVENSPVMPQPVTSYNAASSEPSALGVYDPNLKNYDQQGVVTGYPATGYGVVPVGGFAPLGPLPASGNRQQLLQGPYATAPPEMTRRQKRQARRAQRASDPERKAARRKRIKVAMIVAGVMLGFLLV